MKHLKTFENEAAFSAAASKIEKPWVALVGENMNYSSSYVEPQKDPKLTRWYNGEELIKEHDVVGELTMYDKEKSATRCEIGTDVTSIGEYALQECRNLTEVVMADSVTSIGNLSFESCVNMTDLTISNTLSYLDNSAFSHCGKLTNIYCNSVNEPCTVRGGSFQQVGKNGKLHVAKGGSAATYPTWMNDQGNLGYGYLGKWTVVDDL